MTEPMNTNILYLGSIPPSYSNFSISPRGMRPRGVNIFKNEVQITPAKSWPNRKYFDKIGKKLEVENHWGLSLKAKIKGEYKEKGILRIITMPIIFVMPFQFEQKISAHILQLFSLLTLEFFFFLVFSLDFVIWFFSSNSWENFFVRIRGITFLNIVFSFDQK